MVKATCQRILGDAALAEDAAQDVFLLLVRKLPSLPPQTILGGWLYVTACNLARTHQRTHARRQQREKQVEAATSLMKTTETSLWRELEPLLDEAMLTLSQRQRELVLLSYFQNNSQRAAAALVGCSESVASRELAAAIETLRRFFSRHGVTVSATALVTLLSAHGAQAPLGVVSLAGIMSSTAALAGSSAVGSSLFVSFMKATTITKVLAAAAALFIISGTVLYFARTGEPRVPIAQPKASSQSLTATGVAGDSPPRPDNAEVAGRPAPQAPRFAPTSGKPRRIYDEAALRTAREKQAKFIERLSQLALITDPQRVQDLLAQEYGIRLSETEVRRLLDTGPKGFTFGVIDLWARNQPQEALAWAVSALSDPGQRGGWDLHQSILDAARNTMPNLNRNTLDAILAEGPGKARMLDLAEATTDPRSLASRILTEADPTQRASRLMLLAQGWSDTEAAVEWARQNLGRADKTAFYGQIGYNLAHQNPEIALQVLAELRGTDSYAPTFASMMRGLVQEGGRGAEAAELIANADVSPTERADLISELSRRWVRANADAAIAWVNTLTAPEDFRAAIPLLVSQLDNDRVSRTVDAYLKNHDPVMELALIEAAAPPGLMFDAEKSRLILDPLISQDPALKLRAAEGTGSNKEEMLWNSVNLAAKRQAEAGSPVVAVEWLATLPFANQSDYSKAIGNVFAVWNLKSPAEAATWLQNASLDPAVKADVQRAVQP
jgi:RNA polymerase sigma factor (sigma-70 family)